jgi:3-dehydroquinate synthase
MEGLHVLNIKSHSCDYCVEIDNQIKTNGKIPSLGTHFVIDKKVYETLPDELKLSLFNVVLIEANEQTKSYQGIEPIIVELLQQNLRRDSTLVAIGGGITQDITCFIATTFMRGIKWAFVPTTLLAQADSCIGSKSSINFNSYKNLLGSFTPPNRIIISQQFLETLPDNDFTSGVGEIAKLLIIAGKNFEFGRVNHTTIFNFTLEALMIKREFIEKDEFDKGIRQILNYGHCIGHGIESATNFVIPHGIAISMGMDVVNRFALNKNLITQERFQHLHNSIAPLYQNFNKIAIQVEKVFYSQTKDKKNTGNKINLVLPVGNKIEKHGFENEKALWDELHRAFSQTPIAIQS